MREISRTALFGKLNPVAYKAIESATVFCKLRGNPYVELTHWLHQILQLDDSDLHRIVRHYQLDSSHIAKEITQALERLPRGANSINDLSPSIEAAVERAWVYATLMLNEAQVRTGSLLLGLLKTPELRTRLVQISPTLAQLNAEKLGEEFAQIGAESPERNLTASDNSLATSNPGEFSGAMAPGALGKQEALNRFAVDLTARARSGEIDPVTGRDEEIRQIIDILMRRRQNNPLLTGEAGVGKTAVVEGFALRLAQGDVPPQLKDVRLLLLDIGLLQAGASMKGEFEQRLRQVIDEVQTSPTPIILFIDEIHTLVGAGGAAGTGDAANLLKPALARGTLRTIGATTWSEYKKYIEKDPALTRRFQAIQVDEPDEHKAIAMLRGITANLESHHKILLLDEAISAAVKLSQRYIPARQLPDKAISLLDTACARVAVSQHATPAVLEDCQKRIQALQVQADILAREAVYGLVDKDEQQQCLSGLIEAQTEEQQLLTRWAAEKNCIAKLLNLRQQLFNAHHTQTESTNQALLADLQVQHQLALQELSELQGENPLVLLAVDEAAVATVVADWTGIPLGRMLRNEINNVLHLVDALDQRVIGQRHALELISRRIQTARAHLDNPNKPIGVFMLVGPSGVGKTETALALAETLYGGEQNLITINMSEFQEAHSISTLKGAPPGYVGYGEGGVLTEAVRRKPYSVVLLDEIEKAHPDVHELFFQVFDKGWMEDGEGRAIDFRNTVILLTSNVGTELIANLTRDPDLMPAPDALTTALREPLLKVFPPAFLGRQVVIPYYPLNHETLANIVRLQLARIQQRTLEQHQLQFTYDPAAVDLIIQRCTELESGGRMIDAILTHHLLPVISRDLLQRLSDGKQLTAVHLHTSTASGAADFAFDFSPAANSHSLTSSTSGAAVKQPQPA
ncbi:type VI secretion system ATPase TssH [Cellvibrio sp. KY-GH-1]|uniref:type VI secretion system ATPase TssH n=1 Tax=Cellvibrio sp. KY-GH-1 TaxID=2303332 RepID=UPI00124465C5|nr:type VI secretion system ATPase TssH [Cellvibrio sp. KY-GH-1]QEY16744.1 type VI secretion system ATPase TssH [Cellvibrio sp. KY-GH-1]